MPFRGFTSLATSNVDIALKNDLNNLERYLREVATQISLLNKAEPLGSAQSEQGESSIANHAATHGNLGSDSIEGYPFTWTGAHIFKGNDDVIIKNAAGKITHRFLKNPSTWLTGNITHRVAAADIVSNGATFSIETINAGDDPIGGPWTALADNDILGQIKFNGVDTLLNTSTPGTRIRSKVDGTIVDGFVPAEMQFWTTSGTDHAARMVIKNTGWIGLGTNVDNFEPSARLEITGDDNTNLLECTEPNLGTHNFVVIPRYNQMHVAIGAVAATTEQTLGITSTGNQPQLDTWSQHPDSVPIQVSHSTVSRAHIRSATGEPLYFGTNGSNLPRVVIGTNGNVGIGGGFTPVTALEIPDGAAWFHTSGGALADVLYLGEADSNPDAPAYTIRTDDALSDLLQIHSVRQQGLTRWTRNDGAGGENTIAEIFGGGTNVAYMAIYGVDATPDLRGIFRPDADSYLAGVAPQLGIGTKTPGAMLDVRGIVDFYGGTGIHKFGSDSDDDTTRTNATTKQARLGVPHYTNAEQNVGVVFVNALDGQNRLNFGGGTSNLNASTSISFFAAADSVTTTGTEVMTLDSSSLIVRNPVDFYGGSLGPHIFGSDFDDTSTRTNATIKTAKFTSPHYLSAEENIGWLAVNIQNAQTELIIGGGISAHNACEVIRFYTAANDTELVGTEHINLLSTGVLQRTGDPDDVYIHEKLAAPVATGTWVYNEGVTFGATVGNQTHVSLKGKNTSGIQRRGGSIEWYTQNNVVGGYTYLNGNLQFVFDTAAQANRLGSGNAWVECDTGNASFAALTTTTINAGGVITADGLTLGDNEPVLFGDGTDMELVHDATDNYLRSNIAEGVDAQSGVRIEWDIDTDQTSIVGSGANRPGVDAQPIMSIGWTDAAQAWNEAWAIYPYQRAVSGQGPGIVTTLDNWFVGSRENSVYTGMEKISTSLNFLFDSTVSFKANASGIELGGASAAEMRSEFGLALRFKPQFTGSAPSAGIAEIDFLSSVNHTASSTSPYVAFRPRSPSALLHVANVWGTNGALALGGISVTAGSVVCFDDSTFTQGANYLAYASGTSELQAVLSGDAFALMNGKDVRLYDTGDSNYVGFKAPALSGNQIWTLPTADGNNSDTLQTDGAGALSWKTTASEKAWAFESATGSSGIFYYGGFYDFGASNDNFNPSLASGWGTTNKSYAAHFFVVAAAGGAGGTDTVIRITGTSITDAAVRTAADTEDLTLDDAGAAGAYYETTKKWIGNITVVKQSGPDLECNYGWTKYWDNNNTDFIVDGIEVTILAGANDTGFNLRLLHHKTTGWTYNAGSTPTPPTPIAALQTDHVTEYELANNENAAWKRDDLATAIAGGNGEGTIWEITTTANRAVETGNILMRITS